MKNSMKGILAILILTAFAGNAFAFFENWQKSPWTEEKPYVEKSINKLGFGLLNMATGWSAILFEPFRYSNKFTGLVKGIWRTVTNTSGGAIHTATFFIPVDVPLPDGGVHFDIETEEQGIS
jgi:hypothetical protein